MVLVMANWVEAKVINIKWWNEKLFSIKVEAKLPPYKAGQFTKLAMTIKDKKIARAYSFVNAPSSNHTHEFLLVTVEDGLLSPPLSQLSIGETLLIAEQATGFFTLDEVPKASELWLLATGTAIGPFLAMLNEQAIWQKFKQIILVHGVRKLDDLVYQDEILSHCEAKELKYVPYISQESKHNYSVGRITHGLESGELFKFSTHTTNPENSQFMLCGNPEMVKECTKILLEKGFARNRRANPGHITVEQYW